ncbi:MAG: CHAT domain-containing protein [Bryobacteraceae bacterium]
MEKPEYTEILIRILGKGPDFDVEADLDDGSQFRGAILRLNDAEEQELFANPARSGLLLGKQLSSGQIQQAFNRALTMAEERQTLLRVRLRLPDDSAALQSLPWERVEVDTASGPIALSASPRITFSRYISLTGPEPSPVFARPVRMLFAIANPHGVEAIAVEQEVIAFANVVAQIDDLQVTIATGRTSITEIVKADLLQRRFHVIDGPLTLDRLQHAAEGQHIVHLLAHGRFNKVTQFSEVALEDLQGQISLARDSDVIQAFNSLPARPQLIFLASCETAVQPDTGPIAVSLGPKFVRAGIPAVVAMQAKVPMQTAQRLTVDFYRGLLSHGIVDRALSEARTFLYDRDNVDWAVPVLFHRIRSGRLFQPDLRLSLRNILNEPGFEQSDHNLAAHLEAVLLPATKLSANWEHTAAQTRTRVNLWDQTLRLPSLAREAKAPLFFAVAGPRGMSKSTHLRRFAAHTARQSLESREIFPLYVNLENYPSAKAGRLGRLESLMLETFQSYTGPQTINESYFRELMKTDSPSMRVILDNGDDLPEADRVKILREIGELLESYPTAEFWLGMEQGCWNLTSARISYLLAIQLLTRTAVEAYLADIDFSSLAQSLASSQLFDLAALPWSLDQIVKEARRGALPDRRLGVLRDIVEEQIAALPRSQQSDARRFLCTLGRQMQKAAEAVCQSRTQLRSCGKCEVLANIVSICC